MFVKSASSMFLGSSGSSKGGASSSSSADAQPVLQEPPGAPTEDDQARFKAWHSSDESLHESLHSSNPFASTAIQSWISWSHRRSQTDEQDLGPESSVKTSPEKGRKSARPSRISKSFSLMDHSFKGTGDNNPSNYFLGAFTHHKQTDYLKVKDMELFLNMIASDMADHSTQHCKDMANMQERFKGEISALTDRAMLLEQNTKQKIDVAYEDLQQYTKSCCRGFSDDISATVRSVEGQLQKEVQNMHSELRELCKQDIFTLSSRIDADLNMVRSQLNSQTEEMDARFNEQRDARQNALRSIEERLQQQISTVSRTLDELNGSMTKAMTLHGDQIDMLLAQHAGTSSGFGKRFEQMQSDLTKIAADCDNVRVASRSLTMDSVSTLRHLLETWLNSMEDKLESLNGRVSETASIPTRRVEWIVHNVRQIATTGSFGNPPSCRTWLSPKFQVAGASNMQLELNLLDPDDDEDESDCALTLIGHASALTLVCKLYIGELSAHCNFTFGESSQRCTRRFSVFSGEVSGDSDPLRIGVEVLEAIRTVATCREHVRGAGARNQAGKWCRERTLADDGDGAAGRQQSPDGDGAAGRQQRPQEHDGSLLAHQYVNHHMLDLVRDQVNQMHSRMTKRVEWRLENASQLRRYFAEGESLCSSTFMAAGLEGLQLVFYPSGYDGAREGFCSLFLYCPGGTTLRCLLSAGKQRREARISFVEHPGFFGRTNFCRYESCVETSDDTVLLALEIEEARQMMSQSLSHVASTSPASPSQASDELRAPRSPPGCSRAGTKSPSRNAGESPVPSKGGVESVLKMQRLPGKLALEDVKQLPSIWTSVPAGNIGEVLEGFHKFSDMRPRTPRKSNSARRHLHGASADSSLSNTQFFGNSLSSGASRNDLRRNDFRTLQKYKAYVT